MFMSESRTIFRTWTENDELAGWDFERGSDIISWRLNEGRETWSHIWYFDFDGKWDYSPRLTDENGVGGSDIKSFEISFSELDPKVKEIVISKMKGHLKK